MKREFLVAVGGAAIVVAGLSGCSSSDKKETSSDTTATASASATTSVASGDTTATTGAGTARVVIDGTEHKVEGTVVCATVAGNVSLTVGQGMSAVSATLSEGDKP
nr:lipoprotein LpqH [Streptomyces sp. DSM 41633]